MVSGNGGGICYRYNANACVPLEAKFLYATNADTCPACNNEAARAELARNGDGLQEQIFPLNELRDRTQLTAVLIAPTHARNVGFVTSAIKDLSDQIVGKWKNQA